MIVPVSRFINNCKFFSIRFFIIFFLLQITIASEAQKLSGSKKNQAGQNDEEINTPSWTADNGNGTYTNPLFYDEFSDPDMIRVWR